MRLDNKNHGSQPRLSGFWQTKMLPATNIHKIALCRLILIFVSLYHEIDPTSLIHVHFKFMNFARTQLAIKGQKNFFALGADTMDWPQRIFCLPPYCMCRLLSLSFFWALKCFLLFLKNGFLAKGSLSGKKRTKLKKAANHDLYYPDLYILSLCLMIYVDFSFEFAPFSNNVLFCIVVAMNSLLSYICAYSYYICCILIW